MALGPRQALLGYWLPVLAYVALIFTLSSIPNLRSPFHFRNSDKVVHAMEYSILGLLLTRALRTIPPLQGAATAAGLALMMGSTIGALDEIYQKGTPGRDSIPLDWLADTFGLTLSCLLYLWYQRRHAVALARRGGR